MTQNAKRWTISSLLLAVTAGMIGSALFTMTQSNEINVNVNLPAAVDQFDDQAVTPPEKRFGLAPDYQVVGQPIQAGYQRPFSVASSVDRKANARLWAPVLAVHGKHFLNVPQQTGDCVSWGLKNAIRYRLAFQAWKGKSVKAADPFAPYLYGLARVTVGGNRPSCRSAGAYPAYAIKGFQEYGWITESESAQPYSGRLADNWGCDGPPRQMLELGKARAKGDAYPIRSTDELIEALTNGYPCTIASDFGTSTIRQRDGRQVAEWDASWPHQMCIIAYDGSGSTPYFYVINSWGANAHPKPLGDEPPGGFWVTLDTVAKMIRTGEFWAISDVPGFPANELDWSVFDRVLKASTDKPATTTKSLALAL